MELTAAIARRRMVRAFSPEPVEREQLDRILDLSRRGPSAGNTQATSFLVLDRPDAVARYWDTTFTPNGRAAFRWQQLFAAPTIVIVATDPSAYVSRYAETDKGHPRLGREADDWEVPYWWVDAGAVAQNLLLCVVDQGLGACLFGLFQHETAVKARFAVPEPIRLVASIAIGHPLPDEEGRSAARPRPPLDHIAHRNGWKTSLGGPSS